MNSLRKIRLGRSAPVPRAPAINAAITPIPRIPSGAAFNVAIAPIPWIPTGAPFNAAPFNAAIGQIPWIPTGAPFNAAVNPRGTTLFFNSSLNQNSTAGHFLRQFSSKRTVPSINSDQFAEIIDKFKTMLRDSAVRQKVKSKNKFKGKIYDMNAMLLEMNQIEDVIDSVSDDIRDLKKDIQRNVKVDECRKKLKKNEILLKKKEKDLLTKEKKAAELVVMVKRDWLRVVMVEAAEATLKAEKDASADATKYKMTMDNELHMAEQDVEYPFGKPDEDAEADHSGGADPSTVADSLGDSLGRPPNTGGDDRTMKYLVLDLLLIMRRIMKQLLFPFEAADPAAKPPPAEPDPTAAAEADPTADAELAAAADPTEAAKDEAEADATAAAEADPTADAELAAAAKDEAEADATAAAKDEESDEGASRAPAHPPPQ